MKQVMLAIGFLILIGAGVFLLQQQQEKNVEKTVNKEDLTFSTQSANTACPQNINTSTDLSNFTKQGYLPAGVIFHEKVENQRTGATECHYKDPKSGARIPGKLLLTQ